MRKYIFTVLCLLLTCPVPGRHVAAVSQLTVKAVNRLHVSRPAQTIELSGRDLAPLGETDLTKIHVRDSSGRELLCQAVDTDYDDYHKPDVVIFQSDFAPDQTRTFTAYAGAKQVYAREQFRAYGRFVRERFDDFAWENDLIAHRTYGKALSTWKGEPLTSSAIDIWSKRVPKLVINDWYMADNYHTDTGEGLDAYSAGPTRGDGGSGVWANGQLYIPSNFVDSRVLSNGPIRVLFELVYEPFDAGGRKVSEVLRVSLDAGSQLDHYQSFYKPQADDEPLAVAVGLKKVKGARKESNAARGLVSVWEPVEKGMGMQGLAVIVNPREFEREAEDRLNNLVVLKPSAARPVSYWAGFAWDRAGKITSAEAWKKYVDEFAEGLLSPIEVSVSP